MTALGVLAVAGVGGWALWSAEEPAVAVPDRVCQEMVPSTQVKSLLPERGEAFEQASSNFVPDSAKGLGSCELTGGGKTINIRYGMIQAADFTLDSVTRDATEPGKTPLSLGPAKGYLREAGGSLLVACPYEKGRNDLLDVSVGVEGLPDTKDGATTKEIAALTADVARAVAREVENCEGADELPDTAPEIG
ncbi:hypothetical protein [Streptomyces sp. NPDC050428]|uniref:hypothetical protein n=1 Tax=Streptomyces sp. NPDC050428 TaxID=3155757 RepID=UPI0034214B36